MKNQNWTIIGTKNTEKFLEIGAKILETGGSALDAVEKVINAVEENPLDLSVGFNGLPNLTGVVELDASIMVGSSKKTGAIAGLKINKYAISIARKVMELSPHVLLVGEGADRFAQAVGFTKESLMDERNKTLYSNIIQGKTAIDDLFTPEEIHNIDWRYDDYLKAMLEKIDFKTWYDKLSVDHHGTVNVIALDQHGELCSGVSTSGLALKFPGRVGDSPIIGAGNYCDLNVGAATCTGKGELSIRLNLAGKTVFRMESLSVEHAVVEAIKDVKKLNDEGVIHIIAMDKQGKFSGCSNKGNYFVFANNESKSTKRMKTILI